MDRANLLARDSGDDVPRIMAAYLYASRHERDKIDPRLFRYRAELIVDGDQAYWLGEIYALLGDKRQALTMFRRTVELGDTNYPWFERNKNYASLHGDPEFQEILASAKQRWQAYKNEFDPGE